MKTVSLPLNHYGQLLSESMIVGEHPNEPMVIHAQLKLKKCFPFDTYSLEKLINLTETFLQHHPQLCQTFNILKEGTPKNLSTDFAMMARCIWQSNSLSLDAFRHQKIDMQSGSLLRFKLSKEDGFSIAAHHALLDGRALFQLQHDFLSFLITQTIKPQKEMAYKTKEHSKLKKIKGAILYFSKRIRELLYSPLILGSKTEFGVGHALFYTHKYQEDKIKDAYKIINHIYPSTTLNDLILTTIQVMIYKRFNNKGQRQSLLMPMDLRKHGNTHIYNNLSSGININYYPKNSNKLDIENLFKQVKAQTQDAKKYSFELKSLNFLERLKKLGILEESRRFLISKGLPRRCFKGTQYFWRFASTAIFANMGHLRFDKAVKEHLDDACGFPAIISPTSLAMTAFFFKNHLIINYHTTSQCLELSTLQDFATSFNQILEEVVHTLKRKEHGD